MNNDQEQDRGEFAPAPTVFNDLASLKYKTTVGPIESAMREQRIQDGDLSRSNQSKGNNMSDMNIIKLAQECQLIGMRPHLDGIYQEALEKFAELVAAQEREACARLIEGRKTGADGLMDVVRDMEAAAIRKRGTT